MQHPVPPSYYDANDPFGNIRPNGRKHTGSDYGVAEGSTVESVGDGVVYHVGFDPGNGNYVCVYQTGHDWDDVEGGLYVAYLHLSETFVQPNTTVVQGQAIGLSGNTGTNSSGPHLHVTFSNSDRAFLGEGSLVDPFGYIERHLGGSSGGGGSSTPEPAPSGNPDYVEIQTLLAQRGYYTGTIDGQFGTQSWTAVQLCCGDAGFYDLNYLDGVPGRNTYIGMQMYAQKNGNYPWGYDGELGPKTWAGFTQSLREDAPRPTPPAPPVAPPTPPVAPPVVPEKPETVVPEKPETPKEEDMSDKLQQQQQIISGIHVNDLGSIITDSKTRKIVWAVWTLFGLALVGIGGGFMAIQQVAPDWVIFAGGVSLALQPAFGSLAMANIGPKNK